MNKRQLICIGCPLGCQMEAEQNEGGEVVSVKGNTCPRGDAYSREPAWLWWRRETLPPGEPHLRMGTKIRPLH